MSWFRKTIRLGELIEKIRGFRRKRNHPSHADNMVRYEVSIGDVNIKFACKDAEQYKHIELCLVGIAKLLNLVEETNDWEKFTALMQAVVEELRTDCADIEDEEIPKSYVV